MTDAEQPAFTCRNEKGGEAVYLDLAVNRRILRVAEVDYEERVDLLIGDDIGLITEVSNGFYALVAGKALEAACFLKILIQHKEVVDIHSVALSRCGDTEVSVLFIHGELVIDTAANLCGSVELHLQAVQGGPYYSCSGAS